MSSAANECDAFRGQLLLLRDADQAGRETLPVVEHLETCTACRTEYRELIEFEENVRERHEVGGLLTPNLERQLRARFDDVVRARGTGVAMRRFSTRGWRSVLATAAVVLVGLALVFVATPPDEPSANIGGSIYSASRGGAQTLAPGAEYHLLLESDRAAAIYVINFDGSTPTIVIPFADETGTWDALGYDTLVVAAGERRIVPSLDSGARFVVDGPSGSREYFFLASTPTALQDDELSDLDNALVELVPTDVAGLRAFLRTRFETVESLEFEVE